MHRSWNPHKVCNACVREQLRERDAGLASRVRELETRHERIDVAALARVHERWLARQPADHPWRSSSSPSDTDPASLRRPATIETGPRSTVNSQSRVAVGGGEA